MTEREMMSREIGRLRKKNKRYREAIEKALERLNGTVAERYEIAMLYTDLVKALEGDHNN